jgi:hypothetical protein
MAGLGESGGSEARAQSSGPMCSGHVLFALRFLGLFWLGLGFWLQIGLLLVFLIPGSGLGVAIYLDRHPTRTTRSTCRKRKGLGDPMILGHSAANFPTLLERELPP